MTEAEKFAVLLYAADLAVDLETALEFWPEEIRQEHYRKEARQFIAIHDLLADLRGGAIKWPTTTTA